MNTWTIERKSKFYLTVLVILLVGLDLTSASMSFRSSGSIAFAMLDMIPFISIMAFIVVRRLAKLLLNAKRAADLNGRQLQFQLSLIRAIHDASLDAILVVDRFGIIVSHNKRFFDIWQAVVPDAKLFPHDVVGISDHPLFLSAMHLVKNPDDFAKEIRNLYRNPGAEDHSEIELKDGRVVERYSTSVRSEDDEYLGRVWFFRDITKRKRDQEALRSSEEKFRQMAENIREVLWMMPSSGDEVLYVSPAYEQLWGRSCDSLYQNPESRLEAIHPEDRALATELFKRQLRGERLDSEYRVITPDNCEKWILDRAFPVHDEAGDLIRIAGIAEEITERKHYEAKLEQTNRRLEASEERYRNLIDSSPDAILVERGGAIVLANRAAFELLGASSKGDVLGRRIEDFVSPDDCSKLGTALRDLYAHDSKIPMLQIRVDRTDGSFVDAEVSLSSFFEDGELSLQAVLRDITLRKQREATQAQLLRGIEQVAESIVVTDIDGSIKYVNPAFEKVTGYTRVEVIGGNPRILKSGQHSVSFYQGLWETLQNGETWSGTLTNKRKDGTLFKEIATISPIKNDSGTIVSYVAVKRDITHEIMLRDQMNQAEKWKSMGRLAGGIAHDFNNLLMVMRTYAEILHGRLSEDGVLRESTEQMLKAVDRGAGLTGQMLAFCRQQINSPTVINLNAVVNDTAKMLRRVIGEDIDFQVDLSELLWAIEADRDQMTQILINLCVNARDAMPRGGTLRIATANVSVGSERGPSPAYVAPGEYTTLTVADSGMGVRKEIQREIFEPFFTTKGSGSGTGLGLAMVYGIVKQSSGYVWLDSEVGQGARFTIYLPRVKQALTPTVPAMSQSPLRGVETLLVVEDEEPLRRGICAFLSSLGYRVFAAGSAEEALVIAENQDVDLLLTDVVMPRTSGRELAQLMADARPSVKVIYVSGYTDDAVLRNGIHTQQAAFLQKPFGLNHLARKVRDVLDSVEPLADSTKALVG